MIAATLTISNLRARLRATGLVAQATYRFDLRRYSNGAFDFPDQSLPADAVGAATAEWPLTAPAQGGYLGIVADAGTVLAVDKAVVP